MLRKEAKKIIVTRAGFLGDTLVAVPALRYIRNYFKQAKIVYLQQVYREINAVAAEDVLGNSGLVDEVKTYYSGKNANLYNLPLLFYMWLMRFDLGIILEKPNWASSRVKLFRLGNVKEIITPELRSGKEFDAINKEIDSTASISGKLYKHIKNITQNQVGDSAELDFGVNLTDGEIAHAEQWLQGNVQSRGSNHLLGIAPFSNMPSKEWPLENYVTLINRLAEKYDAIPIILGGRGDKEKALRLQPALPKSVIACGELNVRESIALMAQCDLIICNDSGPMHMAVSSGAPCIAIFSGHGVPGLWEPEAENITVIKQEVPCSNCGKRTCETKECLSAIKAEYVLDVAGKILSDHERKETAQ